MSVTKAKVPVKVTTMHNAIATYVHDDDTVAIEGFTACICFAVAHEIIRQGRRAVEENIPAPLELEKYSHGARNRVQRGGKRGPGR